MVFSKPKLVFEQNIVFIYKWDELIIDDFF